MVTNILRLFYSVQCVCQAIVNSWENIHFLMEKIWKSMSSQWYSPIVVMQAKNFISVCFDEINLLIFETAHTSWMELLSAVTRVIEAAIFMLNTYLCLFPCLISVGKDSRSFPLLAFAFNSWSVFHSLFLILAPDLGLAFSYISRVCVLPWVLSPVSQQVLVFLRLKSY